MFNLYFSRTPTSRPSPGPVSGPPRGCGARRGTRGQARPPRAGTRVWATCPCPRTRSTPARAAWTPPPSLSSPTRGSAVTPRTCPELVPGRYKVCNCPPFINSLNTFRSQQSLKTPLLDQTNTPKAKNTSKIGRTPINFKKFVGSAFRSKKSKSYKMMDIQDKTINRDQNNLATPMKAKEKSSKSPVKKMKV